MDKDNRKGISLPWFSLRGRVLLLLAALVLTNLIGAGVTVWFTHQSYKLNEEMVQRDLAALMAAQGLERALVMQKGFVTYYFLDGDTIWLKNLNEHHQAFEIWLKKARRDLDTVAGLAILNEIESEYIRYVYARDHVIQLYKQGERKAGAEKHWGVRDQFYSIVTLCESYKRIHEQSLKRIQKSFLEKTGLMTVFAWMAMPAVVILGLILAYVLLRQILGPIRQLALIAASSSLPVLASDEVKALRTSFYSLKEDADQAHSELEQSREHLIQAEKMALVGRLAAGMAHSIRNPLTSVKMRLFSLERSLDLLPVEKEDFEVISEEISHIDTILSNFLEFSRPPKLDRQLVSPSDIVDTTLQLVRHRLDSYGIAVNVDRKERLPNTLADPEQLKEVLMNLIFNASEVMADGGAIDIHEEESLSESGERMAVIRVADNGPGIPESIRDRIFEPFFSTKEEGSGLGLSIAKRIMDEHGGRIGLASVEGQGTAIFLALPCKEE